MMQGISRKSRHAIRRARRKREVWMNIVSMIDILTVLVFFLLMNATGVSILGLELPSASAAPAEPPAHQLSVTLGHDALTVADNGSVIDTLPRRADGHYDLDALGALLIRLKQEMPHDDNIVLLMEPTTSYDALVAVMDTVKARLVPGTQEPVALFSQISLGDAPTPAGTASGATP